MVLGMCMWHEGDLVRGHQCEMSERSTTREGERESVRKARAAAEKSWTTTVKMGLRTATAMQGR